MDIANIYTVENQTMYRNEDNVMLLAHILKQGLYKKSNFKPYAWIILDNGLYEDAQVSTDLLDLIKIADECEFHVNEIVIPDAMGDGIETMRLLIKNLKAIHEHDHKYTFMFVAHTNSPIELYELILTLNDALNNYNISIGIPKRAPFARDSEIAIKAYKVSKFPIHFLGIKESLDELINVKNVIRSCDTSQISTIILNEGTIDNVDVIEYKRKKEGKAIDLIKDKLSKRELERAYLRLQEELKLYGFL